MQLALFHSSRPPSQVEEIAEVDVTPVMNMFIILIPFLVSMAIFTQLSIIEFSIPPSTGTADNNLSAKPQPKLTVRIGNDYLGIILGENILDSLAVTGSFPFDSLEARLKIRAQEISHNGEIIIASRDNIPFKQVVKVMDLCKGAGFEKIGLSSATADPGELAMKSLLKRDADPGNEVFRPQLTSLVDVMTILLVFLIKSFSVEGNLVTPSQDLLLPVSVSVQPPRVRSSIEITKNEILSDGNSLVLLKDVVSSDSLLIEPLFKWMRAQRSKYNDSTGVPEILIQCDREIEFLIVKKAMYSCTKAGFSDFLVLVIQED